MWISVCYTATIRNHMKNLPCNEPAEFLIEGHRQCLGHCGSLVIGGPMKDYAASLYKSRRWQETRKAYLKSVGGLCERCLKKGLYHPAVIVHHKVYISPENINNPEITLSWGNLEAVCRECHEAEHRREDLRYTVSPDGSVEIR